MIKLAAPSRLEDAAGRYIEFCKTSLPKDMSLHGMRLVVDCAHGAAYRIAPKIFWELGAQVIRQGVEPDGMNVNRNCGALHPQNMAKIVEQNGASLGIALDGDADRLILSDERGNIIDGDQIIAAMAVHLKETGKLKGNAAVATVMSNMGLEEYLKENDMALIRTKVGDHYVEKAMREGGYNLGGENSGHMIFRDYATTGDGILAALQVLSVMKERGWTASRIGKSFTPWPMKMENIRFGEGVNPAKVLEKKAVQKAIEKAEKKLGTDGRVLVRKSGTEPLIRVMVEARTEEAMQTELQGLIDAVNGAIK